MDEILFKLSNAFTVSEIMTQFENIKCASNFIDARKLARENNFTIIPLKSDNIKKYFDGINNKPQKIEQHEIISSNTSIFDVISYFSKDKTHLFVLHKNRINGIIHFSDLNNPFTKLFLFSLIENIERNIYNVINRFSDEVFLSKLNNKLTRKAMDFKKKQIMMDINNGWFGAFTFKELLLTARNHNIIEINSNIIDTMNKIRNLVAHTHYLLLGKGSKSLIDLQRFKENSIKILGQLNLNTL